MDVIEVQCIVANLIFEVRPLKIKLVTLLTFTVPHLGTCELLQLLDMCDFSQC